MTRPTIEIDIDAVWTQDTDWETLAVEAARAAAAVAPELADEDMLVSVVLATDGDVHDLNRQWRAKDAPTNVLSFPMLSREEVLRASNHRGDPVMLGDVILAHETCTREAEAKGVSLSDHVSHLLVHGLLHLAGHDHAENLQADAMEALEIDALARLSIDDPYTAKEDTRGR